MASVKICLILVIGTLFSSISDICCVDYEESRSIRSTKDDNDGYGSSSANYNFQYAVADGGNNFGHEEERTGRTTKGSYRVLLPDGRMQIVTYTADENGYRADVTYESGSGSGSGGYSSPDPAPSNPYIPPAKPSTTTTSSTTASQGYGSPPTSSNSGSHSTFGRRNSGSFVKSRRNIKGQNHNYNYTF